MQFIKIFSMYIISQYVFNYSKLNKILKCTIIYLLLEPACHVLLKFLYFILLYRLFASQTWQNYHIFESYLVQMFI
jgi:hypothetical protein